MPWEMSGDFKDGIWEEGWSLGEDMTYLSSNALGSSLISVPNTTETWGNAKEKPFSQLFLLLNLSFLVVGD